MIRMGLRAGVAAVSFVSAAACGTAIDGGSDVPPLYDVVWCDVQALPCVDVVASTVGLSDYCAVPGLAPVPASPPGGRRACFDSAKSTPEAACAALCSDPVMNTVLFPSGCTAQVDTDATAHPRLGTGGYEAQACTAPTSTLPAILSGVGTNIVDVIGAGTATYAGVSVDVAVVAGRVVVEAPNTRCTAAQSSCPVQLNQVDLTFADFTLAGLSASGLTLSLVQPSLLPYGSNAAGPLPARDPLFGFPVLGASYFDATGDVRAGGVHLGGVAMQYTTPETNGTIDLVTGEMALQVSAEGVVAGQLFDLDVSLRTSAVVDAPPKIVAPAIGPIDGGSGCMVKAPLTATATSPVGLPVTVTFAVDDGLPALAGPTATGTLYGAGSHTIRVLAVDSLGVTATATATVDTAPSCP